MAPSKQFWNNSIRTAFYDIFKENTHVVKIILDSNPHEEIKQLFITALNETPRWQPHSATFCWPHRPLAGKVNKSFSKAIPHDKTYHSLNCRRCDGQHPIHWLIRTNFSPISYQTPHSPDIMSLSTCQMGRSQEGYGIHNKLSCNTTKKQQPNLG